MFRVISNVKGKVKEKKKELEKRKQLEKSAEEKVRRKELEPLMKKYGLSYEEAKIYANKLEKERKKKERRKKIKDTVKSAAKGLHEYGSKQRSVLENDRSHTLTPRRDPFDFSDLGFMKTKKRDPFDVSDLEKNAKEIEKMLRL